MGMTMVEKISADASPEKRLFISLITRDITLTDAFLDLIDNSINAALEPMADDLKTADDYQRLLANKRIKPKVQIELTVSSGRIEVHDNAAGIAAETARKHVFKFGKDPSDNTKSDRLSVYGLGLKRAMFKCGNKIHMISDHSKGGFELKEDVQSWAEKRDGPWTLDITPRAPVKSDFGTSIVISQLHDEVLRRLDDGLFIPQLKDRIARTYSFFIGRVVDIFVNGSLVEKESFEIGANYASHKFRSGSVSCNITAGMAVSKGDVFRDRNAGWFVFCNGRTVLFADKTSVTGWSNAGLPIFQPKHRPFLGTVFFVSPDPEALPWTTTKAAINEENIVWQGAKREMVRIGRVITEFLDHRYSDEGTRIAPSELQDASGAGVSVLTAAVARARTFKPPIRPAPRTVKIQYDAKTDDVGKIITYLRRPSMSGSEVGRYTFNHFLKNEVGGDE